MSKEVLKMKNITKEFPGVVALDDVSFSCREGEVHALMGENGAGKSTLIKLLSGDSKPTKGEIFFNDEMFTASTPHEAMKKGIAIIYQELNLVPNLNACENIFMGREPKKGPMNDFARMKSETVELLKTLHVEIDINKHIGLLSVANQQMIEIAKALSMNAQLIVMDEPTSSLTSSEVHTLFKVIEKLKGEGVTIIYITHHLDEIFEIADRVTVLKDGQYVGTKDIKEVNAEDVIKMMVGRKLEEIYPPKNSESGEGEVVLEVISLNQKDTLNDISFNVRKGEIVSLAGLMGAGRTELAEALFGETKADSGEVLIHGKRVSIKSPSDSLKSGMGFLTEDRKVKGLVLGMTVKENATLTLLDKLTKYAVINKKAEREIAGKYVSDLRIKTPSIDTRTVSLSGGNQQKVVLSKWLARDVEIIILDEPTRGIDVGAKIEIYNLMRELANSGKAILMISSELPEVIGMSDRVIVMRKGTLVGEVMPEDMTEENILTYAMGGQ